MVGMDELMSKSSIWRTSQLVWLVVNDWKPAEIENLTAITIEREGLAGTASVPRIEG